MSDATHFDCAKVLIPDECSTHETEGATYPFKRVRVITVNGQIWAKNFYPFGLDEDRIRKDWDKRMLDTWILVSYGNESLTPEPDPAKIE